MIFILWPTIRPDMMSKTYNHWLKNHSGTTDISLKVAVNTEEEKLEILKYISNVEIYVVGTKRGLTTAVNTLSNCVHGNDGDIIILASDDMYAPKNWDKWITSQLKEKTGCLHVNDGYIKQDNITIPIMDIECLKRLNNIIYHPSYIHQYSDTELYHNLKEMNLLIDKWKESPIFEHKNWACQKRKPDDSDAYNISTVSIDAENWSKRSSMSAAQRLKK